MKEFDWRSLDRVAPDALLPARLVLHHAAQLVAAVGASLLPPRPDDSHPNLGWSEVVDGFVGRPIESLHGLSAALRPRDLSLLVVDADGSAVEEIALEKRTRAELLGELQSALERAGGRRLDTPLALPGYELPHHDVAEGSPFPGPAGLGPAPGELGRWFAGADTALRAVQAREPGASDVRCWPHHFDIATLIVHASDDAGSATQTIGVGLSPGDESYTEPYWYVSPWPQPGGGELPSLGGEGHWHREGFTAAILPASRLLAAKNRAATLETYLDRALAGSRQILGG